MAGYAALEKLQSRNIRGMIYHAAMAPEGADWVGDISSDPIDAPEGKFEVGAMGAALDFKKLNLPRTTEEFLPMTAEGVCEEYDLGMRVREKDMRRDLTNLLRKQVDMRIGTPVKRRWRKLLSKRIESGETDKAPDGVAFYSASHVLGKSGTQSNLLSENVTVTTALTDAEMQTVIWNAVTKLQTYKDDQGQPIEPPTNFLVMAHPIHARALKHAINLSMLNGGSFLIPNDLQQAVSEFSISAVLNPYLAVQTAIYVFVRDGMAFLRANEYDPKQESLAEGSDFATLNLQHAHFLRFSHGTAPYRWESSVKTNLT